MLTHQDRSYENGTKSVFDRLDEAGNSPSMRKLRQLLLNLKPGTVEFHFSDEVQQLLSFAF